MGEEQDNILYINMPRSRNESPGNASIQGFIEEFAEFARVLKAAYMEFREAITVKTEQIDAIIALLQTIRRRANALSESLHEKNIISCVGVTVLYLDGTTAAKLILDFDAFKDIHKQRTEEQRKTQIALQSMLAAHVRYIEEAHEGLCKLSVRMANRASL